MRKLMSLLLVPMLVLTIALPVFGSDYRETALKYLTEKYDVLEEDIELYEGGITTLEFTGEAFWFARYIIATEGETIPRNTGGGVKPAPDSPTTPSGTSSGSAGSAVSPSMDIHYDNTIYGAVYIHLGSGEVLGMTQMEDYYQAERVLAEKEWERLRKEAGKLEVSLYQRLKGLAVTEEVTVLIRPVAVITEELLEQFQIIKDKYPRIGEHLQLEELLLNNFGYDLPMPYVPDAGPMDQVISSDATVGSVAPAKPYPADGGNVVVDPAPAREPMLYDDDYWQEQQAFWQAVEEIRVQAVEPSLKDITAILGQLDVTYKALGTSVEALLTGAQINQIANLSSVATIGEQYFYGTMDAMWRGNASAELASTMPPMSDKASEDEASQSQFPLPIILTITGLCVGIFVVHRRLA